MVINKVVVALALTESVDDAIEVARALGLFEFDYRRAAQNVVKVDRLVDRRNHVELKLKQLRNTFASGQTGDQERILTSGCGDAEVPVLLRKIGHVAISPVRLTMERHTVMRFAYRSRTA